MQDISMLQVPQVELSHQSYSQCDQQVPMTYGEQGQQISIYQPPFEDQLYQSAPVNGQMMPDPQMQVYNQSCNQYDQYGQVYDHGKIGEFNKVVRHEAGGHYNNQYAMDSQSQFVPEFQNQYVPESYNQYVPESQHKYAPEIQNQYVPESHQQHLPESQNQYILASQNKHIPEKTSQYNNQYDHENYQNNQQVVFNKSNNCSTPMASLLGKGIRKNINSPKYTMPTCNKMEKVTKQAPMNNTEVAKKKSTWNTLSGWLW